VEGCASVVVARRHRSRRWPLGGVAHLGGLHRPTARLQFGLGRFPLGQQFLLVGESTTGDSVSAWSRLTMTPNAVPRAAQSSASMSSRATAAFASSCSLRRRAISAPSNVVAGRARQLIAGDLPAIETTTRAILCSSPWKSLLRGSFTSNHEEHPSLRKKIRS
jgi:hypothetical protein